jgi:hypothetical protein
MDSAHHQSAASTRARRFFVLAAILAISSALLVVAAIGHSDVSQIQPAQTQSLSLPLDHLPTPPEARPSATTEHWADPPLSTHPPAVAPPPDDRGLHLVNSPVVSRTTRASGNLAHRS